jgi:DNA-binding MarR family transcriptional regulator
MSPKSIHMQIRDRRRQGWFSIDNEVIDDYSERLGHHGIAVYCALARHAKNDTQETRVGVRKLAKKLKMGPTKLTEILALLEDLRLISIEHGDYENPNVYTLLEVPKGVTDEEQGVTDEEQGVTDQYPIKTIFKNSSIKKEEAEDLSTTLLALDRWPYDRQKTIAVLAKNSSSYPKANVRKVIEDFEYAVQFGTKKPIVDLPATLRTYFRKSQEWSSNGNAKDKNNAPTIGRRRTLNG